MDYFFSHPSVYVELAEHYQKLGETQKALEVYNLALKLPIKADAYYNRAIFYSKLGEKQKALEDYKKAAQLYQQQGNTYWYERANNRIKELSSPTKKAIILNQKY